MGKINFFYEDIQPLLLEKNKIKKHINRLINRELKVLGDLSFIFCSDKFLLEINKQYLDHDYYTDIITFDYVDGKSISGDLFISIDRVKENAKNYEVKFKIELFRVMFHGVLHLCGYTDKKEQEQKVMRGKEDLYLCEVDFSEIEL